MDSVADNRAFHEKFAFAFPLLSDVDGTMAAAFDCCRASKDGSNPCEKANRVTVVVDASGVVKKYVSPFDARSGPSELLEAL